MGRAYDAYCDRRAFIKTGLGGVAWAAAPAFLCLRPGRVSAGETPPDRGIRHVLRSETLFAGIRKPITTREQLEPRVEDLEAACGDRIAGPLTHIFRFDTPVDGFDSEIGYPVSAPVSTESVSTHTLRTMHFYARTHEGPLESLRVTTGSLYEYMNTTGLSAELELVEVYPDHRRGRLLGGRVEVMASHLAWPEVYREQLIRVLGREAADAVWAGGDVITPHTPVDPRCAWVGRSIGRLKQHSDVDQQFDILSRVALRRPLEDIEPYRALYEEAGDITAVFRAQEEKLKGTRTGGFLDPPYIDGRTLHVSKVPYNKKAYAAATTREEKRKAYCFCNLVREASDPRLDPIFCYRAAGWARQLWELVLGVEFSGCTITHSILKGDDFCAWDYRLGEPLTQV